ncbi:MAG: lipid-binding SYLF domain-containing protein [Phycisphaerales bacterium]|nr:lipid-binding SYLF domain-containing protein [Phycisphaerales bacterium]
MKTRGWISALRSAAVLAVLMSGCTTAPRTEEGRSDIRSQALTTVAKAQGQDSTLANALNNSTGYAVFPTVGKGAVGIGAAYGKGVLFEHGVAMGYCDLTQASIGLQLGGQGYSEIIVFSTPESLAKFKTGNFAFDAQATAVALKAGAGANAKYADGVAVSTMDEAGLMYEASIGGQKFSYQPL